MANRLQRFAPVINLGSRAVGWGKNLLTAGRSGRIADRTDEIMENFQRMPELEGLDHAELVRRATRMATSEVGPGVIKRFGMRIGLISAAGYAGANGIGETASGAFNFMASPIEATERMAQRRMANVEAVQATIAGLEAQVAGQTPLLGILGFLQSLFPENQMIQEWIDDRQDKIASLREQMANAGTAGYGEDDGPASDASVAGAAITATVVGATVFGAAPAWRAIKNYFGGGGNDDGGNNSPDRTVGMNVDAERRADHAAARANGQGDLFDDTPERTRAANVRTPRLGGRLGRRLGSFLNLKNAFVGAAGTAALAGTAHAADASAEYTVADGAQDVVTLAVPVAADVIDVVGHVQDGEYGEAAVTAASATAGGLAAAFASATTGAAIGTFIPIPIVGTALGFVGGAAVGIGTYMLASSATETGLNAVFNREANAAEGPTAAAPVTRISFLNSGPSAAMA